MKEVLRTSTIGKCVYCGQERSGNLTTLVNHLLVQCDFVSAEAKQDAANYRDRKNGSAGSKRKGPENDESKDEAGSGGIGSGGGSNLSLPDLGNHNKRRRVDVRDNGLSVSAFEIAERTR